VCLQIAFAGAAILINAATVRAASYTAAELEEAEERQQRGERPLPRKVSQRSSDGAQTESFLPPVTTAHSSAQALALGRRLADMGAVMYGGYACSHCYRQKEILGREALEMITYVECGKGGANVQRAFCKEQKHVKRFPSWEINGQMYEGDQSLQSLARLAQFDLRAHSPNQKL
jgi:glutaredoxin